MLTYKTMKGAELKADFCIAIDFKKDSENPSRVFRTISDLIDTFHAFDVDLVQSIDATIEPVLLLEDIETGSVRTWLSYVLKAIEDDALKNLDWKPAVGKYIVKAKYCVINFLENKTEITNKAQIEKLEKDILQLASETDVKHIPAYEPISRPKLLQHISDIVSATSSLTEGDSIKYISRDGEAPFNLSFRIVPEVIEDLMTKETIESTAEMIFKVKKPDYLGDSMWDFKHEKKTISAKIHHADWLAKFQNREVDVRPGDSIRAKVGITTKYDDNYNVIAIRYAILEVIEVIKQHRQGSFLIE